MDRLRLLPCPFCGEPPTEHYGENSKEHWVACESESCEVCPTTSGGSIESARRAWNRRLSLSQEAVRDEALEEENELLKKALANFSLPSNTTYPSRVAANNVHKFVLQLAKAYERALILLIATQRAYVADALKREPNAAAPELEVETEFRLAKSGPKYEFDIEGWPISRTCSDPQECRRANRCLEIPPCGKFSAMTGASDD